MKCKTLRGSTVAAVYDQIPDSNNRSAKAMVTPPDSPAKIAADMKRHAADEHDVAYGWLLHYAARVEALGERQAIVQIDSNALRPPPDAKKDPATFKLGDNPNEYADDDAKPVVTDVADKGGQWTDAKIGPGTHSFARLTDAKPDALEEWRNRPHHVCYDDISTIEEQETCEACQIERAAIAAWEKERAEFEIRRELLRTGYESVAAHLNALRAAVEDARIALLEGMNQRPGAAQVKVLRAVSDALDAALGGGA